MRSLTIAAGIASFALPLTAAHAAILTVGGPLSRLCYEAALAQDDRQSAIDGCTRSLDEEALLRGDRAGTYVNRGILRMNRGEDAAADADFDAALALERDLPDAWLNKAFIRLRQGDGRDALPLLDEGLKHNPDRRALAIFARGVAYEQMGEFGSAYADLKRAHEIEPGWALPSRYLSHYRVVSP
ncbi:MAG TPA: tetratricopeptide repeat protein [Sphingomicrobium sp.]|nr:tetratricopeptide repeat protein [Sphingomicrobium sp.]